MNTLSEIENKIKELEQQLTFLELYDFAYKLLQQCPACTQRKRMFDELKKIQLADVDERAREIKLTIFIRRIEEEFEV